MAKLIPLLVMVDPEFGTTIEPFSSLVAAAIAEAKAEGLDATPLKVCTATSVDKTCDSDPGLDSLDE